MRQRLFQRFILSLTEIFCVEKALFMPYIPEMIAVSSQSLIQQLDQSLNRNGVFNQLMNQQQNQQSIRLC